MRKSLLAASAAITLIASPTYAMTGAEFKQADRTFASGYVLGVVEARVLVVDTDDKQIDALRACVYGSKADSETLYNLVFSWLGRNPKGLPMPVIAAIYNAVNEMCGR